MAGIASPSSSVESSKELFLDLDAFLADVEKNKKSYKLDGEILRVT